MTRRAPICVPRAAVAGRTFLWLLAFLSATVTATARADEAPSCDGPFNGREVSAPALTTVMEDHRAWLGEHRSVLLDAIRAMSQFRDVVATMDSAAFLKAMADPRRADLCGARLAGTDFAGADLAGVDFTGADLSDADLTGANLTGADLTGADLSGVGLAGASLIGTDLTGTRLAQANLFGVVFEPRISGMDQVREDTPANPPGNAEVHHAIGFPDMDAMAQARNLDRMVFATSPTPLQRLKDAFAARGHRAPSRQVMASLQWAEDLRLVRNGTVGDRVGGALRVVLLGITCSYGAAPGRALGWLLCLVLAFTIPYARVIALDKVGTGVGAGSSRRAPGGIPDYALAGANAGLGLTLLAPWLVLNPGPGWFRHLVPAGGTAWGGWAFAPLVLVPVLYVTWAGLLAATVALRRRWRGGRTSTPLALLTAAVLIAGLLTIPTLAFVSGASGQPSAFGEPLLYVLVWVLLLLALMHTAGSYAEARDGEILARWKEEQEERPVERVDAAFFRPQAAGGPATGQAPVPPAPRSIWRDRLGRHMAVTKGALWFSLIISCRIGWKDLSLGTWLTHIQPRPYNLAPTGGLRVICGIQSVIGSYLLALLLLTYFRPLFSL